MVKKWIPEGDSYTEVRVGCSSSCLRVEIADCSLSEGGWKGWKDKHVFTPKGIAEGPVYLSIYFGAPALIL